MGKFRRKVRFQVRCPVRQQFLLFCFVSIQHNCLAYTGLASDPSNSVIKKVVMCIVHPSLDRNLTFSNFRIDTVSG